MTLKMNKLAENKYSYLRNFPLKKQNQLILSETKRTKPPPPPPKKLKRIGQEWKSRKSENLYPKEWGLNFYVTFTFDF